MKILVKPLREIAVEFLLDRLDRICLQLEKESGNYDDPDSKFVANEIKDFFKEQLAVSILEDLVKNELKRNERHDYDARLKWTILMQPDIVSLGEPTKDPNVGHVFFWAVKLLSIFNTHDITLMREESFWHDHMIKMTRLKVIGLPIEATDDLLDAISSACSAQLVSLTLSSFCAVTDVGLKCLETCKRLKTVVGSFDDDSTLDFVSLKGLSSLLSSCPNLEFIFGFNHLGELLNHMIRNEGSICPLKLNHYTEVNINYVNIQTIEELCPHLTQINLQNDGNLSDSILLDLANSNLNLKSVILNNFPYDSTFKSFFEKKGKKLNHVDIFGTEVNLEILKFIGKKCPQVKSLGLAPTQTEPVPSRLTPEEVSSNLFSELRELFLFENNHSLDLNPTLSFIAANALGIESIFLFSHEELSVDEGFAELLKLNKLNTLESLWLVNVEMSLDISRKMLHQLPNFSSYYSECASNVSTLAEEFKGFNFLTGTFLSIF